MGCAAAAGEREGQVCRTVRTALCRLELVSLFCHFVTTYWFSKSAHDELPFETDVDACVRLPDGCRYDRSRVSLVQTAADGTEFVLVNAIELDYLEEIADDQAVQTTHSTPLSWAETMEFLDALLERGTQPERILAHAWCSGQLIICEHSCMHRCELSRRHPETAHCPIVKSAGDNRSVFHSPTPYASHPDGTASYASLPEPQGRRLMARTFLTSDSWEPASTPP